MTTARERTLGEARAALTQLPDLVDELARLKADRHHDLSGYKSKVVGSPAPLQIPVVHLTDQRHKARWHGEDPRELMLRDRYGVAPTLEAWVRVLAEEMRDEHRDWPELTEQATVRSECATLLENWQFIADHNWALDLAQDVATITGAVKNALGVPKEIRYRCPECHNPAHLAPGGILSCTEGHERVVRDLEQQQRRRPRMTTRQVVEEFPVTQNQLWQWKHRRKIRPIVDDNGHLWWLPWDVFCLLNPDIAEVMNLRDEEVAG